MKATSIFYKNLKSKSKYILNIGGARSSKSYSIMQLLIYYFVSQKNKKFLITRKTRPALKISCWELFLNILKENDYLRFCEINKSDLNVWLLTNNNMVYFRSIDDPEKIKSTEFNYIFMEEASEFDYEDYIILKTRLSAPSEKEQNKLFMAMNPIACWIEDKLINNPEIEVIRSSYKDNPFLSQDYIKVLENLKNENEKLYKIYTLGEFAILDNIIYSNYDLINNYDEIIADEIICGLDFGFNNPTALVEVKIKDKEIYLKELLYKTNLTNSDLIQNLKEMRILKNIYADSAEPQRIEELNKAGIICYASDKSVKDGIDFVKRFKLHIDSKSNNLIKEIKSYSYKQDKTGKILEEPVKFNDHLIDAMRYAIYTHLKKQVVDVNEIKAINLLKEAYLK